MEFLYWLEGTGYADWVAGSQFGYVIMLSLHAVGLATIVGIIFAVDLRILGLYRAIPCASLSRFQSLAWYGIGLNLFTGLSIFITQASYYVTNVPFLLKISLIIIGAVNLFYIQKTLKRDAENWDSSGTIPASGLALAGTSILFWTLAVVTGRLIAYL